MRAQYPDCIVRTQKGRNWRGSTQASQMNCNQFTVYYIQTNMTINFEICQLGKLLNELDF